jgi:hypothetical protein
VCDTRVAKYCSGEKKENTDQTGHVGTHSHTSYNLKSLAWHRNSSPRGRARHVSDTVPGYCTIMCTYFVQACHISCHHCHRWHPSTMQKCAKCSMPV